MNLKEIQILQEAYMSVYEETDAERDKRLADRRARVAELQVSGRTMTPARRAREKAQQRKSESEQEKLERLANSALSSIQGTSRRSEKPMGSTPPAEKERAPEGNRRLKSTTKSDTLASRADEVLRSLKKEDVNIFDVLISHLLDEGYADDVKNAYCILENMSEDWVLEILDEKFISPFKGPPTSYKDITPRSPATKAMQKSDELQRTEPGSERQKKQTRRSQQLNRLFQAARRA